MYPPTLKLVLFYSQLLLVNGLVWGQLVLGYFFSSPSSFLFSFLFLWSFKSPSLWVALVLWKCTVLAIQLLSVPFCDPTRHSGKTPQLGGHLL